MTKMLLSPQTWLIALAAVALLAWVIVVDLLVAWVYWPIRKWLLSRVPTPRPDLFLLHPLVRWEGAVQRPQHLAFGLVEQGRRVAYIDPTPLHWIVRKLQFYIKRLWFRPDPEHSALLLVTKVPTFPGEQQVPLIRKLNLWHITQWMRLVTLVLGGRRIVVMTHVPGAGQMVGKLDEDVFWYDIIDDFTVTSWIGGEAASLERQLIARADIVTTGTHALLEKKCRLSPESFMPNSAFIQCGVHAEHFAPDGVEPLPMVAELPSPVIGYFGVLNERLNGDMLLDLAKRHPDWHFALIGPVHNDFDLAAFGSPWITVVDDPASPEFKLTETLPNLHFLGLAKYEDLPRALAGFDVAILPYRRSPITEVIHPVKLMEYLAGGKPVVCTNIPDVERFYSGIVGLADSPEDFERELELAITKPEAGRIQKGLELARSRTWQRMADEMLAFVESGGRKV